MLFKVLTPICALVALSLAGPIRGKKNNLRSVSLKPNFNHREIGIVQYKADRSSLFIIVLLIHSTLDSDEIRAKGEAEEYDDPDCLKEGEYRRFRS